MMIDSRSNRAGTRLAAFFLACFCAVSMCAQTNPPKFRVIAFYTGKSDKAHISFVREANRWFPKMAAEHGFVYDATDNWENLNPAFLAKYQVVLSWTPGQMRLLSARHSRSILKMAADGWGSILRRSP